MKVLIPLLIILFSWQFTACTTINKQPELYADKLIEPLGFWYDKTKPDERNFASVMVDDGYIYISKYDAGVIKTDSDGNIIWRFNIEGGSDSTPKLNEGKLYVGGNNGYIYCLDPKNAKVIWEYKTEGEVISEAVIDRGVVYFRNTDDYIYALDAKTGKFIWSYNRKSVTDMTIRGVGNPLVYSDKLFVTFSDGTLVALNRVEGNELWVVQLSAPDAPYLDVDATPIVFTDSVIVPSYAGNLFRVRISDGKIIWNIGDGSVKNVIMVQGKFYYLTIKKRIVSIMPDEGKILWEQSYEGGLPTKPVYLALDGRDYLFIGTTDRMLHLFDIDTKKIVWSFNIGSGVTGDPVLANDEIIFLSNFGNIYSFKTQL